MKDVSVNNASAIEAVREARHRISEMVGHDPRKLVEHYLKRQELSGRSIIRRETPAPPIELEGTNGDVTASDSSSPTQ